MKKQVRFNNHRTLRIKRKHASEMGHNSFMLEYFFAKRVIMNDYKYVNFQGGIYEVHINNPIHGGIPVCPKKMIKEQKIIAVWLGKQVA